MHRTKADDNCKERNQRSLLWVLERGGGGVSSQRNRRGVAASDVRTLAALDYIHQRQIMAMTRETSDPALGAEEGT